jgi:hypothetical protein
MFVYTKKRSFDRKLYDYFYENSTSYAKQRLFFKDMILNQTDQNKALIKTLNDNVEYVLSNFKVSLGDDSLIKNINAMYLRFGVILLFLFFFLHMVYHKQEILISVNNMTLPVYISIVPLCFMVYFSRKAFMLMENAQIRNFSQYVYKRIYAQLFWLFAIVQLYLYWIFIFKHHIFFFDQDYLFSYGALKVIKQYTIVEKHQLFDNYFLLYAKMKGFSGEYLQNLCIFLEEVNYKLLIDESTTMAEIREAVENVVQNYKTYLQDYYTGLEETYLQKLQRRKLIQTFMDPFINIINIITFWKFFIAYLDAWYIITPIPPLNPRFAQLLIEFIKVFNKWK